MSTGSVIRSQQQHKVFVASVSDFSISILFGPSGPSSPTDLLQDFRGDPCGAPPFCLGCAPDRHDLSLQPRGSFRGI